MLRLAADRPAVEKYLCRLGRDGTLHRQPAQPWMCQPYLAGEYIYGVDSYGQFRCLEEGHGRPRLGEPQSHLPGPVWGSALHGPLSGRPDLHFQ